MLALLTNKDDKWQVVLEDKVLSEWETEEVARAYCVGYNEALKEQD